MWIPFSNIIIVYDQKFVNKKEVKLVDILDIIGKKRDKKELTKEEIEYFVKEYTAGNIADYQAAALVMAIYINGMTKEETAKFVIDRVKNMEKEAV